MLRICRLDLFSTPFWEFPSAGARPAEEEVPRNFLLPFGSFDTIFIKEHLKKMGLRLSTPFWEFQLMLRLLGFLIRFLLSTPFWEFLNHLEKHLSKLLDVVTFYSLLGVSFAKELKEAVKKEIVFLLPFGSF